MEKKIALAFLLVFSIASAQSQSPARTSRGAWSGHAVSLFSTWGALDDNSGAKADLVSPDGKKTIQVRGKSVTLVVNQQTFATKIGKMTNPELIWSPDSLHFVITSTSAGELGKWEVRLFQVTEHGLHDLGVISEKAAADYASRIKARARDREQALWQTAEYCDINVAAVKWIEPARLALATLVPNTSACRRMSDWDGYIVKVPLGDLEERVPAKEMIKRFGRNNVPRGN